MSKLMMWGFIVGFVFILLLFTLFLIIRNKRKNNKTNKEFPELLKALGGLENITNLSLNGSRISLNFNDKKSINKEQIKENGVETIVFSNKKMTLVIGKNAPVIYKYLQENLSKW